LVREAISLVKGKRAEGVDKDRQKLGDPERHFISLNINNNAK
jgi:hypothetical protein